MLSEAPQVLDFYPTSNALNHFLGLYRLCRLLRIDFLAILVKADSGRGCAVSTTFSRPDTVEFDELPFWLAMGGEAYRTILP